MVRGPFIDKNGVKKGAWSKEEDDKLSAYIKRYGHWNWRELPKFAGLQRCGKSCRLRWVNYLKPNVKRGNYTKEEDDLIIKLHDQLGNKWSRIAEKLPGRSDNEIKNHWHTNLKKRSRRPENQNNPDKESSPTISSSESESDYKKEESMEVETSESISANVTVESGNTISGPASSTASFDDHTQQTATESPSGSEFSSSMILNSGDDWVGDFWSEPFQVDFGTFPASPPSIFVDLDYDFFSPVAPALDDEIFVAISSI